jgi:predicted PhzF superfamily epimerase YddE/YHI9
MGPEATLSGSVQPVTQLHVLRVFCGKNGTGGNPLGVVLEGDAVAEPERQALASRLGFSETVFVDDPAGGVVRIFTPGTELPFAGHPLVGTAWLLAREGCPPAALRPPAGEVPARHEGDSTYVSGRPEWAPAFELEQLSGPEEVDALEGPPGDQDLIEAWAWIDEGAGVLRARVFPPRFGIAEDEATGAAAVRLCAQLGRPLDIRQGRGSRIVARPGADGMVEIGGRVALDEVRPL